MHLYDPHTSIGTLRTHTPNVLGNDERECARASCTHHYAYRHTRKQTIRNENKRMKKKRRNLIQHTVFHHYHIVYHSLVSFLSVSPLIVTNFLRYIFISKSKRRKNNKNYEKKQWSFVECGDDAERCLMWCLLYDSKRKQTQIKSFHEVYLWLFGRSGTGATSNHRLENHFGSYARSEHCWSVKKNALARLFLVFISNVKNEIKIGRRCWCCCMVRCKRNGTTQKGKIKRKLWTVVTADAYMVNVPEPCHVITWQIEKKRDIWNCTRK